MKFWIKNIQKSVGITTIYVTHDQSEALTMSDRIAVMDQGRVLQIGTPVEIYEQPASRFIAEFIGESNLLHGTISALEETVVRSLWALQRFRAVSRARHGQCRARWSPCWCALK